MTSNSAGVPFLTLLATASAAWVGVACFLPVLRHLSILDNPVARSSHSTPTPRGAGLPVIAVAFTGWVLVDQILPTLPSRFPALLLGIAVLAFVSAMDDVRDLSPLVRLVFQIGAACLAVVVLAPNEFVFQGVLPLWLDRLGTVVGLIWLMNVFNFMDGIDGITLVETTVVASGAAIVLRLDLAPLAVVCLPAVVAGSALGCLPWNWAPAKVFLGDVGSIPLGYMVGWILVELSLRGLWVAALILPLYFLVDATVTLTRRLLRGDSPWSSHREHYYQRATPIGCSHAATVLIVLIADAILALLSVASLAYPTMSLSLAFVVVGALLQLLRRRGVRVEEA